jgi:2-polyprenyl-3-methyl-5-hydroxy-6-metoxy-1,4-benzoquinol methylase
MSVPELFPTSPPNGFDNLVVDVAELHRRFPVDQPADLGLAWNSPIDRLYAAPFLPLTQRAQAWQLLRRVRLDLTWFERFRRYWGKVLGGRPLWGVEDFYFLRNIYRMRFQSATVPDTTDAGVHLAAWQRPEVLSHLFHSVYKESLNHELRLLRPLRALQRGPLRAVLEFGCGSAPITTTLCEFQPPRADTQIWISDIEAVPFHYAAHKLAAFRNVHAVPLRAENRFRFPLAQKFDVIFCMTVLEHLQEPLAVLEHLRELLAPGGLLFFDYVKSDATGLDTVAGRDQRPATLAFVREHFRLLQGSLDEEHSIGLTIATPR